MKTVAVAFLIALALTCASAKPAFQRRINNQRLVEAVRELLVRDDDDSSEADEQADTVSDILDGLELPEHLADRLCRGKYKANSHGSVEEDDEPELIEEAMGIIFHSLPDDEQAATHEMTCGANGFHIAGETKLDKLIEHRPELVVQAFAIFDNDEGKYKVADVIVTSMDAEARQKLAADRCTSSVDNFPAASHDDKRVVLLSGLIAMELGGEEARRKCLLDRFCAGDDDLPCAGDDASGVGKRSSMVQAFQSLLKRKN